MKKFLVIIVTLVSLSSVSYSQFVEERKIEENETYIDHQEMEITVIDDVTKKPMTADIIIRGLNPRKTVIMKEVEDTIFEIENYRIYTVSCIKKGFMIYSDKFWPEEVQLHVQEVALQPIEVGAATDLRDIYFVGNKTQIYGKSREAIDELISWLKVNKNVKIAIIGHVNGPNNDKSERYYQKASVERANAIVAYLVSKGIKEDRLVAKGKGNTMMLYPNPKTNWETEANRRIEIEVIGL